MAHTVLSISTARPDRGKIGKFMKQKAQINSADSQHSSVDNNKTYKAQVSRFCNPVYVPRYFPQKPLAR